ncbi:MAG: hypothetical protein HY787_13425 [Deltaproteobacteria bacterium]|nr:hypothetical protein [Deltaproteobacteria bacterium]
MREIRTSGLMRGRVSPPYSTKNFKDANVALEFTNEVLEKLLLKLDEFEVVSFDQGFKFLGVTFVRSLIMVPFDRPKRERRVLYMPPFLPELEFRIR